MTGEEEASIPVFRELANCPNFGARVEDALLVILVHFEGTPNMSHFVTCHITCNVTCHVTCHVAFHATGHVTGHVACHVTCRGTCHVTWCHMSRRIVSRVMSCVMSRVVSHVLCLCLRFGLCLRPTWPFFPGPFPMVWYIVSV